MGEQILLIVVLTSVAAGFALLWRRLNALELDVRILRAALEQARAEGVHSAETKTALSSPIRIDAKAPAETLANAPLQEATPGPATAEPSKPPSPRRRSVRCSVGQANAVTRIASLGRAAAETARNQRRSAAGVYYARRARD